MGNVSALFLTTETDVNIQQVIYVCLLVELCPGFSCLLGCIPPNKIIDDHRSIWGYNRYREYLNLHTHHGHKYYSTSPLKYWP